MSQARTKVILLLVFHDKSRTHKEENENPQIIYNKTECSSEENSWDVSWKLHSLIHFSASASIFPQVSVVLQSVFLTIFLKCELSWLVLSTLLFGFGFQRKYYLCFIPCCCLSWGMPVEALALGATMIQQKAIYKFWYSRAFTTSTIALAHLIQQIANTIASLSWRIWSPWQRQYRD